MENLDDVRTKDLPDDLTPFITRTTQYPISGGGYGDVWQCNYNRGANGVSESALVAVKAFKLPERYDLEAINRKISREIGILKIVLHKNIVPLLGIATGFGRMSELRCLVSPWMPNGTLNVYLASNHNDLTILDRARLLEDVSAGLRYLHSIPVMHGDITGANILIDKGGHARLIDFGLSTITQPLLGQSHLAATSIRPGAIRYAAPELVLSEDVRALGLVEKTDIYSFGCVMLQILSGLPPWSEITSERPEFRIVVMISEGRRPQRPNCHPKIVDSDWNFIQKCLQSGLELRPSADEVLEFVVHRPHPPDSCGRPPDDPSYDTPDDFPGASPHGGSDDSDTLEQPSDSPPLHSDHKLKTLITVADNSSASTSSTPAFFPLTFPNYGSGSERSHFSTTPRPRHHSREDLFLCLWTVGHGLHCNNLIHGYNIPAHVRQVHGISGSDASRVLCAWDGCNLELEKAALSRHVEETHLGIVYSCDDCGAAFSRQGTLSKHKQSKHGA